MDIQLIQESRVDEYKYSVMIPSWNNLAYLRICYEGLKENSSSLSEKVFILNEGSDGSIDYLKSLNDDSITILHSKTNIGICYALNLARHYAKADYLIYMNDDMYPLPEWDTKLIDKAQELGEPMMVSSTMIEPHDTGNPSVVFGDYGDTAENFQKSRLLKEFRSLTREDWLGSTWPPNMVSKKLWDTVGGMSTEYHPGFGSDPDFTMKLYSAGVRKLIGAGDSLVYHFGSKSTGKIKSNPGKHIFEKKWNMKRSYFINEIIKRGQPASISSIADTAGEDTSLAFKIRQGFGK